MQFPFLPMLSRPGPLPRGPGWSFEVKWDGFRALVSTQEGLRVSSRRGWDMTHAVPGLAELPAGLVLDGELIAFNEEGDPHFPLLSRRILHGDRSTPVTLMIFDLLQANGENTSLLPYAERRARLEQLGLDGPYWSTPEAFDDGAGLYAAVCERGLEGVVAKWRASPYRPGARGWIKIKNPDYWRRESEIAAVRRSAERRAAHRA